MLRKMALLAGAAVATAFSPAALPMRATTRGKTVRQLRNPAFGALFPASCRRFGGEAHQKQE